MDKKIYEELRITYRNLIQNILTSTFITNTQHKDDIHKVYLKKNIKKSIDNELSNYYKNIFESKSVMKFTDTYWNEYEFENSDNLTQQFRVQLDEFYLACDKYFNNNVNQNKTENIDFNLLSDFINQLSFESDKTNESTSSSEHIFPDFIVNLAKEISTEIDIPKELTDVNDPKEILQKMMSQDGQQMIFNMMNKVSSKLNNKIDSGELDADNIQKQAQDCLSDLMNKNPGMNEMINKMTSSFIPNGTNTTKSDKNTKTRERLQNKLKNKKTNHTASKK